MPNTPNDLLFDISMLFSIYNPLGLLKPYSSVCIIGKDPAPSSNTVVILEIPPKGKIIS